MKTSIRSNKDLQGFLATLSEEQLARPASLIAVESVMPAQIFEAEVTEEPFLENPDDRFDIGYPSELRRQHGKSFRIEKYKVMDPIGHVIFYAK